MRNFIVKLNTRVRALATITFAWSYLYGSESMSAEMFANLMLQWLDKELHGKTHTAADLIKLYSAIHYNTPKTLTGEATALNDRFTIEYTVDDHVVIKYNRVSRLYSYKQTS